MEGKPNNQVIDSAVADLTSLTVGQRQNLPPLLLASTSPRRAEILLTVGWPFTTTVVNIDESRTADEAAPGYVERLARDKAEAAATHQPSQLVLGADTVVVVDKGILGKPRDEDDARRMLRLLSGRQHEVLTGIALVNGSTSRAVVAHETTQVVFAAMSEDEIRWYVETGEPMDKAGAYAIQGRGSRFIEGIEGDYYNVMGLPVRLLYTLAQKL